MDDSVWTITVTGFAAFLILVVAVSRGWREWLEVRRLELTSQDLGLAPSPAARIELAALKERVRRLEAIASGTDV